jgi:hypothetical protein
MQMDGVSRREMIREYACLSISTTDVHLHNWMIVVTNKILMDVAKHQSRSSSLRL